MDFVLVEMWRETGTFSLVIRILLNFHAFVKLGLQNIEAGSVKKRKKIKRILFVHAFLLFIMFYCQWFRWTIVYMYRKHRFYVDAGLSAPDCLASHPSDLLIILRVCLIAFPPYKYLSCFIDIDMKLLSILRFLFYFYWI